MIVSVPFVCHCEPEEFAERMSLGVAISYYHGILRDCRVASLHRKAGGKLKLHPLMLEELFFAGDSRGKSG